MAKNEQTNYERYFGTPERVALTVATVNEWLEQHLRMTDPPEEGKEWLVPGPYYLFSEGLGEGFGLKAMDMLDWLNERTDE